MADDSTNPDLPDTVAYAQRCYRDSKSHTSEWRQQAPRWFDLVANKQWDEDDVTKLDSENRIPVVINRVARTINAIIGTQVSNRQETRYIPRELGDTQVNEIYTGAAEWIRQGCDAEDEESDAFEDTTTCGMGWTETRMDYDTDPEGTTLIDRLDPLEMFWDPSAKKRNLSDAKWVMRVIKMDITDFEERWPDADLDIASGPWEDSGDEANGQRTHVYPQDAYKQTQLTSRKRGDKIRVAQLQYAKKEEFYRVGKDAERVTAKGFKKIKGKLEAEGIPYIKQRGTVWKQAFIAGGELLEEDDCPYPDGPTLKCITYKRDRNKNTWYGIVAAMMDPQKYGNKFLSLVMDIITKNSKGGVMMETDAVDNPKEVEQKWARPDALIFLRPGGAQKIKERPKADLPAGLDRLVAYFLDSVHEVTGINLELMGMANRDQPGILENQRKQAGITIIAPLFDGLRRYRKEQGRVLLYFIQTYLSDERLIRITGQDGAEQYVPLTKKPGTIKYDVIVDEAPTSPNMKERVFAAIAEMLPNLMKMGIPVPPELLDYSPLPSALVAKWKELIAAQQQGQSPEAILQLQQQLQKLAQENQQLKQKQAETVAETQRDQMKIQRDHELEQFKIQKQDEFDRWKAGNEMGLARDKMDGQTELQRSQFAAEQMNAAVEEARSFVIQMENGRVVDIQRDEEGNVVSANIQDTSGAKQVVIQRGPDGEIAGATVLPVEPQAEAA